MIKAANKKIFRRSLQAVAYPHGEWWIAHCLELDLVAEGKTPEEAFQDLLDIATTQIETAISVGNIESIFRAAPPEIWAMFARAIDKPLKKKPSRAIERFEAREAVLV